MSNLEPGTYALRSVTIGKRMGLGGMYATREEPGAPIHITAKIPSAIDRQNVSSLSLGLSVRNH